MVCLLFSCNKETQTNAVPVISFEAYERFLNSEGKDSLLVVKIKFKDENGDIGYREADTLYPFALGDPYFFNLRCEAFDVTSGNKGIMLDLNGDTVTYNQRLRDITPAGRNKSISGTMEIRIDYFILKISGLSPKALAFNIMLSDRALNKSNTLETETIKINL